MRIILFFIELVYLFIIFFEDVKYICKKIDIGSWIFKSICEYIKFWNGLLIKKIIIVVNIKVIIILIFVWEFLIL